MRKPFIFSPIKKRAAWAALALAIVALIAASCESQTPPAREAGETMTFIGYVTEVRARSLVELESLRVADAAGESLRFHAEEGARFPDFAPSHAREHMLMGDPVKVTYRELPDGTLLIADLADAPPETPAETPAPF